MENSFEITKEKVANTVKEMALLMNCDQKTAYEKYCHTIIKMAVTWEEIEPLVIEDLGGSV